MGLGVPVFKSDINNNPGAGPGYLSGVALDHRNITGVI